MSARAASLCASRRASRGSPLLALSLILMGWVSGRVVLWETPFPAQMDMLSSQLLVENTGPVVPLLSKPSKPQSPVQQAREWSMAGPASLPQPLPAGSKFGAYSFSETPYVTPPLPFEANQPLEAAHQHSAVGHQLLWMAAMAYLPLPDSIAQASKANDGSRLQRSAPQLPAQGLPKPQDKPRADRWSLDNWAFWRQGSSSIPTTNLGRAPSYGASQAGSVLRYELAPSNARRPRLYLRGYSALAGPSEQEVSAGLSARPLAKIPLRLHAEARALRASGRTSARGAAFVTTELPPAKLPLGLEGEFYGQAGYVLGRNETGFADGQAQVTRKVSDLSLAKIRVGAAAFAGAQKGAQRLDVGPTLRFDLSLGDSPARLSVDWRERVAGDAEPDSGVAVTLSTRF